MKNWIYWLFAVALIAAPVQGYAWMGLMITGGGADMDEAGGHTYTYDFAGTGALSGDWTEEVNGSGSVERVSDVGKISSDWAGVSPNIYVWDINSLSNDTTVSMKVVSLGSGTTSQSAGPCVRMTADASGDGYCFRVKMDNNLAELLKFNAGSPSFLDTCVEGCYENTGAYQDVAAGSVLKIVISGTTITGYIDDVYVLSGTDDDYSSGYGGFYYYSNSTAANAPTIDDWGGD